MGAYIDTDPATGRQKITETFTCPHHNTIHPRYDEQGRRIDVAMCRKCMRHVCDECVKIEAGGGNMCRVTEQRLGDYERGFRQLVDRSMDRGRRAAELLKACGLA